MIFRHCRIGRHHWWWHLPSSSTPIRENRKCCILIIKLFTNRIKIRTLEREEQKFRKLAGSNWDNIHNMGIIHAQRWTLKSFENWRDQNWDHTQSYRVIPILIPPIFDFFWSRRPRQRRCVRKKKFPLWLEFERSIKRSNFNHKGNFCFLTHRRWRGWQTVPYD